MFSALLSVLARAKSRHLRKAKREMREDTEGSLVEAAVSSAVVSDNVDVDGDGDSSVSEAVGTVQDSSVDAVEGRITAETRFRSWVSGEKIKIGVLRLGSTCLKLFRYMLVFLTSTVGLLLVLGVLSIGGLFFLFSSYVDFIENGGTGTGTSQSVPRDPLSSGKVNLMTTSKYDVDRIQATGIVLSERQSNLIRLFGLYNDILEREPESVFVGSSLTGTRLWRQYIGVEDIMYLQFGMSSIETGFKFQNGDSVSAERNILKYPSKLSNEYAFLGLHRGSPFGTSYEYSGKSEDAKVIMTESFYNSWASTYHWVEDPVSVNGVGMITNNYIPYGVATSTTVLPSYSSRDAVSDTEFDELCKEFGLSENLDKLRGFLYMFDAAASYHGGGATRDHLTLWVGLWSATSDVDSERGFDKIRLCYKNLDLLDENSFRPGYLGSTGLSYSPDASLSGYFEVNGVPVTNTLWAWVSDHCTNKAVYDAALTAWANTYAGRTSILNLHYGLQAYICGNTVHTDLSVLCRGYLNFSSGIGLIDISSVKAGEIQGNWSEAVVEHIKSYPQNVQDCLGRVYALENPDYKLSSGETLEEWRQASKWKVPFISQSSTDPAGGVVNGVNVLSEYTSGLTSLPNAGCHVYMYSYMASALSGRVINATEMLLALRYFNGVETSVSGQIGWNRANDAVKAFNDLGMKAISKRAASLSGDISSFCNTFGFTEAELMAVDSTMVKKLVDTILDNGGLVGFAGGYPFTPNINHYVVIMERDMTGYYIMDYFWSRWPDGLANWEKAGKSAQPYLWDDVYTAMSSHPSGYSGYHYQMFFVYNPVFTSLSS